jgi:hypothetical protein
VPNVVSSYPNGKVNIIILDGPNPQCGYKQPIRSLYAAYKFDPDPHFVYSYDHCQITVEIPFPFFARVKALFPELIHGKQNQIRKTSRFA